MIFLNFISFKAEEKPQAEPEKRPRRNIPYSLYLNYLRAGGSLVTLLFFLLFGLSAQVKKFSFFLIFNIWIEYFSMMK